MSKSGIAATSIACLFAFSTGCASFPEDSRFHDVHLNKKLINRQAFKDVNDFQERLEKLKSMKDKGIGPDEAFELLGVDKRLFAVVPRDKIITTLTGGFMPNLMTDNADEFARALKISIDMVSRTDAYTIRFTDVDLHAALVSGVGAQLVNSGHDMGLTLIFRDGVLYDARADGTAKVNGKEIHYVWEMLPEVLKGAGVGIGFFSMGALYGSPR